MMIGLLRFSVLAMALSLASGCTAKYQMLLQDRDHVIKDQQDQIAGLMAANADLEERERLAREKLAAGTINVSAPRTDADRVQRELPDLDVRYNKGNLSIGIANTVTFSSGSTSLKNSASSVLSQVAKVLQRDFASRRIYVEGHTDTDPIVKTKKRFRSNRHLSMERADAVVDYLVKKCGVPERQVVVVGFGQYDPKGSNKAGNRRVEIVIGEQM